jgi:hypothetical protein
VKQLTTSLLVEAFKCIPAIGFDAAPSFHQVHLSLLFAAREMMVLVIAEARKMRSVAHNSEC